MLTQFCKALATDALKNKARQSYDEIQFIGEFKVYEKVPREVFGGTSDVKMCDC